MTDWEKMSPNEFRAAGVLWAVNVFVLWPIGLAIGARIPSDDPDEPLVLMSLREAETITEGRMDLEKEPEGCHPRDRFLRYAEYRIAEMPNEMEREMARRKLRALFPGFGVSPIRNDPTS
jgi:hypothetical protein